MSAEEQKPAFREKLAKLSERELVRRIKMATIMTAVDDEFTRRLRPDLLEAGRQN